MTLAAADDAAHCAHISAEGDGAGTRSPVRSTSMEQYKSLVVATFPVEIKYVCQMCFDAKFYWVCWF